MSEILALLTPEVLTLLAYFIGALLIGAMILVGSLYVASWFGWLL
jgi:hypothetical protein